MTKLFTIKELTIIFFLVCVLSIPLILPLLHNGYYPSHDGEWAVVRASEMFREIRDYQFPARYAGSLNFGYGYPLFNFAYPVPYYLATILHVFKFGFVESIKILFIVSVPLSGFFMYLLSKSIWKNKMAAVLSMVLYMYLPYRLVDLYVRGSLGESLSFALYPFIIFCAVAVSRNSRNLRAATLLALSFGILIGTHNIMAVYMLIILAVFLLGLLVARKRREIGINIAALLCGFLLSGFFWLPALLEKSNIILSITPIADRSLYFVNLAQLIIPSWGFGTPTDTNPFTYNIGLAQIIAFILSAIALFLFRKKLKSNIIILFITLTAIFIIMMFPFAALIWNLPLLKEINYPWTLLLPVGFLISIISGVIFMFPKAKIISGLLVLLAIILTLPNSRVSKYINYPDVYYMTNQATTTSSNELMPLWVRKPPTEAPKDKITTTGIVSGLVYSSNKIDFQLNTKNSERITINQIYYPGWNARVNNSVTNIKYNNSGLMQVMVPPGISHVQLRFGETNLRSISNMVSLVTACFVLIVFAFPKMFLRFTYEKEKTAKKK